MTVSNSFLLHAVASMSHIAPISYRRIFNGYGIYHEGVQFAIIINDRLYFRADEASRELYLAKRMEQELTKGRIIELYLNIVELGPLDEARTAERDTRVAAMAGRFLALGLPQEAWKSLAIPRPAQRHCARHPRRVALEHHDRPT